jgi:hypothetical protein
MRPLRFSNRLSPSLEVARARAARPYGTTQAAFDLTQHRPFRHFYSEVSNLDNK